MGRKLSIVGDLTFCALSLGVVELLVEVPATSPDGRRLSVKEKGNKFGDGGDVACKYVSHYHHQQQQQQQQHHLIKLPGPPKHMASL